jgi:methionyl-tRNA synthetase
MSKSRGTFIMARTYLDHLNPEYLRYYYAAKLNDRVEDIDLNLEDMVARVNSNLVGKYINIASRSASFITKRFDGKLCLTLPDEGMAIVKRLQDAADEIKERFEKRQFSEAVRQIMALADEANEYVNEHKPWELAKDENQLPRVHEVCTTSINLFRLLSIYLKPILPALVKEVEAFLDVDPFTWGDTENIILNKHINKYKHLAKRMEQKDVDAMIEDSKESLAEQASPVRHGEAQQHEHPPIEPEIAIDDFSKIDLRIAKIVKAEHVEGADKLLQLTLDIGTETRNVFAGIKTAYAPEDLEGKLTVMVANLAPRKMRFGVSEGMVLAAGPGGKDLWILSPDSGAQPGMRVK